MRRLNCLPKPIMRLPDTYCTFHLTVGLPLAAQVSTAAYAKPDELRSLSKRTLVVVLPEGNPKVIDGFPKKNSAGKTAAYMESPDSYREQVEPAIKEYWKLNGKFEYRTTSENIGLFKKKSTKYVALMKVVLPDGGGVAGYTLDMGVPALVLTRTNGDCKETKKGELQVRNHGFQTYLMLSPDPTGKES